MKREGKTKSTPEGGHEAERWIGLVLASALALGCWTGTKEAFHGGATDEARLAHCGRLASATIKSSDVDALRDPQRTPECAFIFSAPIEFPAGDKPTAEEREILKGCNSEELLYGFGLTRYVVAARKCAFMELEAGPDNRAACRFVGANILTVVYANAMEVPQNLRLAMRLAADNACTDEERRQRVAHLGRMAAAIEGKHEFDLCADDTPDGMGEACKAHRDRLESSGKPR